MRFDEITEVLRFLPPALQDRVMALRPYLADRRCDTCRQIADTLWDAVAAARYRERTAAGHLLARAEALAAEHQHGTGPTGCAVRLVPNQSRRRTVEDVGSRSRKEAMYSESPTLSSR